MWKLLSSWKQQVLQKSFSLFLNFNCLYLFVFTLYDRNMPKVNSDSYFFSKKILSIWVTLITRSELRLRTVQTLILKSNECLLVMESPQVPVYLRLKVKCQRIYLTGCPLRHILYQNDWPCTSQAMICQRNHLVLLPRSFL